MSDDFGELVQRLWEKRVKSLGLPPRLSGDIKSEMLKAAATTNGDKALIKGVIGPYLKDRGRDPETGAKIEGAAVVAKPKKKKDVAEAPTKTEVAPPTKTEAAPIEAPKKKKAKAPTEDPVKDVLAAAGATKALKGNDEAGVPAGNVDLRVLKRPTLKGMAIDLGVKYKKKWTDDELRAKVARKMTGMDSAAIAAIAAADPAKIEGLQDCVGVLLDLTKAVCITCPAQEDCRKLFNQHRENGFRVFADLRAGDTAAIGSDNGSQIAVKVSGAKPLASAKPATEAPKKTGTGIEVLAFGKVAKLPKVIVEGVEVNAGDHKEFLVALKHAPMPNLEAFNALVGESYETQDLPRLAQWLMKYCIAVGAIKLV